MNLLLLHGKTAAGGGGLTVVGPSTAAAVSANVTSVLPSGLQTGHVMLWLVAHSSSSATLPTPAGWTLLQTTTAWSDGTSIGYSRVWQSGDAAPSGTLSVSASWASDIIGIPGSDVNISAKANTTALNVITNALTPTTNNCTILSHAAADASGAARTWTCDKVPPGSEVLDRMDSQIHRHMVLHTLSGGSGVSQPYAHTITGIAEEMGGIIVAVAP